MIKFVGFLIWYYIDKIKIFTWNFRVVCSYFWLQEILDAETLVDLLSVSD